MIIQGESELKKNADQEVDSIQDNDNLPTILNRI